MKGSQQNTFDKNGNLTRIKLDIKIDDLTVYPSRNGSLYMLDGIRDILITDHKRALKEKENAEIKKVAGRMAKKVRKKK